MKTLAITSTILSVILFAALVFVFDAALNESRRYEEAERDLAQLQHQEELGRAAAELRGYNEGRR